MANGYGCFRWVPLGVDLDIHDRVCGMDDNDDYPHNDGEHPCTRPCCEPWTEADREQYEEHLQWLADTLEDRIY